MTDLPPLPESISLLVEVLGAEDTLRLIEARGGTKFWVPSGVNVGPDKLRGELEAEFGAPMVKALIRAYGNGYINVPLCRDWRIALYHQRGLAQPAIARKVGCHVETVRRRLNLGQREDRQGAWTF